MSKVCVKIAVKADDLVFLNPPPHPVQSSLSGGEHGGEGQGNGKASQQAECAEGRYYRRARPAFGRQRALSQRHRQRREVLAIHVQNRRAAARDGAGLRSGRAAWTGAGTIIGRPAAPGRRSRPTRDADQAQNDDIRGSRRRARREHVAVLAQRQASGAMDDDADRLLRAHRRIAGGGHRDR
jgi:hypothetical protein